MKYSDPLPFVLPSAKGCPDVTAEFALRQALIELCRRSLVWREYQDEQEAEADTTTYYYAPAPGLQVVKLLGATLGGVDLDLRDPTDTRDGIRPGLLGFELAPTPTAGTIIKTYSAVAPTPIAERGESDLPPELQRYAEVLAHGALARILDMPRQDWTDHRLAQQMREQFDSEVARAGVDAFRGFSRSGARNHVVWF